MTSPVQRDVQCRSVECYERLNFIDEGTYGVVFRARDRQTGDVYALKQVKSDRDKNGFPVTALREISTLFSVSHENVVQLREVVVTSSLDRVFLAMEYAQHDLMTLIDRMHRPYSASEIKSLVMQLLRGIAHLHANWIIHRDLKLSNVLLTDHGVLKICDFGLARNYADPLAKYTPGVVTLWYRAPELLMGASVYSTAVDLWAVGCIFAELLLMKPLLDGKSELDQISKIARLLGAPSEQRWPGFSQLPHAHRLSFRSAPLESSLCSTLNAGALTAGSVPHTNATVDLIAKMLEYDPQKRISAAAALQHDYFSELPAPKHPSLIQTFPERVTQGQR